MNVSKKSQAGFSLVELMVVVAIIGVLAAVAVPQVTKYIAKARQSEAKTNLASLYSAEKAFYAEYAVYDPRFAAVGFAPEGQIRYNIGFAGGTNATAANGFMTPAAQVATPTAAAALCAAPGGNITATIPCAMIRGATNANPPAIAANMCAGQALNATCQAAGQTFSAGAGAVLLSTGTIDSWSINSAKTIRNTVNGI